MSAPRKISWMVALAALACVAPRAAWAGSDDDSGVAAEASAEEADVTVEAKQHYQAGLAAFRKERYTDAAHELRKAYALKPLPLLLVNLGTTYRKMGDFARAAESFQKYLEQAPQDAPDRANVEAQLREVQRHAVKEDEPAPEKLEHAPIESAPPDAPVDVHASLSQSDVELYVYYRQSGDRGFQRLAMRADGAERQARIPARALAGIAMEYYIQGRDRSGGVVEGSGTPDQPNIVLVDPNAPSRVTAPQVERSAAQGMDDEVAPLARKSAPEKQRRLGGVFYSGLALALVGAGGVALGVTGGMIAQQQAKALTHDSNVSPSFQFSDPNAPGGLDDSAIQAKGKLWNTIGIAGDVGGGVLLAAGLVMMIADGARKHDAAPTKAKRKPAHRDEDASLFVAPSVGSKLVAVSGGFSF
jgi:tetratricopeptide (TPR) repeat protein